MTAGSPSGNQARDAERILSEAMLLSDLHQASRAELLTTGVSQWFKRADPASGSYPRPSIGRKADPLAQPSRAHARGWWLRPSEPMPSRAWSPAPHSAGTRSRQADIIHADEAPVSLDVGGRAPSMSDGGFTWRRSAMGCTMVRESPKIAVGTQPQVFVSYARQDAEQVLQIARLLEREGATVWRMATRSSAGSTMANRSCTRSPTRKSSC